ncbi:MAG: 3,4-dihydroxy-2-butanone-4-phosphate synthase [Bacteriovorax sp.]|nr:3,4-dihydroxy-2-butanone-4-phosphate synthase [Bacteriovorax sp.]
MEKIADIIKDLKAGHLILVTDHQDREDEADLLMAAEFITTEKINFFLNHARGLITVPISSAVAQRLDLPLMVKSNEGTLQTAFTISVDAVSGTSSGISSADRALTIKKLSDPSALAQDFERPGHIFPLIAQDRGVFVRAGHTEAAIDLMKLADLFPVAVLCETLNAFGEALRGEELSEFAQTFKIKMISIDEIKDHLALMNRP